MEYKIALAGNPNCGKTTLFNALTGSNQYVGNWPGVTVEKKEGRLKGHKDVVIQDLPGIYSLSPYTLEEVVARNYLVGERPDAILNIVDGTNIERNLYLTTQLIELGLPVVVAINISNPPVLKEIEPYADALFLTFDVQNQVVLELVCGKHEPSGLLPFQMPADMETVEAQAEDTPRDMRCHTDADGHTYDFAYGLNWSGVINDERTQTYK